MKNLHNKINCIIINITKSIMYNEILKSFKNDGNECALDECDYLQLKLLGNHASQENSAIVLINKKCLDYVLAFKWYLGKSGYAIAYGSNNDIGAKLGKGIKLHKLLCIQFISEVPRGYVVDHINRNKLDNRLDNLRICSQKQNSYNTSKRKNKFKGVSKTKNGWNAKISKNGTTHTIKNISSEKEAAIIYDLMAEELFGQYAGKNYSDLK